MKAVSVLVVDDQIDISEAISEYLEIVLNDHGFEKVQVIQATTVEEAISETSSKKFTVIFSDIRMPNGGGVRLAESIQRLPEAQKSTIYFLSGYEKEDLKSYVNIGVKDLLRKPVNLNDLEEIVLKEANEQLI